MHSLTHIGIMVKDLAASECFYSDVLKCKDCFHGFRERYDRACATVKRN